MTHLVGYDIGFRKFAATAQMRFHFTEEPQVEIGLAIAGAIKRTDGRTCAATRRCDHAVEQHEAGRHVPAPAAREHRSPHVLGFAENRSDELIGLILSRGRRRLALARELAVQLRDKSEQLSRALAQ